MAFPTCRVCRFQTRLSAPTRWLRPQIESSKGKNWLPVTSYDKYGPLLPWSVAVYSIYLLIYLFRNRVPSVPRNRRGSCSVLADRAFWASLRRARIWVYSALIIKLAPTPLSQKENRLQGKSWQVWVLLACPPGLWRRRFFTSMWTVGPGPGCMRGVSEWSRHRHKHKGFSCARM